ncbi:MAG: glutathione S-transferase family protein [Pseudomonadota bacterium]
MILIGQFDSPYVRRVGIALELYGLAYEHRPWSTFGDADKLAAINPLIRVPTLVCDDGVALVETLAILDAIDEQAPADKLLIAPNGQKRRDTLRICALAAGISDKAVALFYEEKFHDAPNPAFAARLETQIRNTLGKLEAERAAINATWWLGESLTHADIAAGACLRHLAESYQGRYPLAGWPALARHSERCEALPVFQKIYQPFIFTGAKS